MADITAAQIFEAMPSRFDPEAAGDWNAIVQFKISGDGGGDWYVTVKDKQVQVNPGAAENATATLETDAETYVGVTTGTVNAQTAFFTGKIKIAGNMSDIMKMQTVFKKE